MTVTEEPGIKSTIQLAAVDLAAAAKTIDVMKMLGMTKSPSRLGRDLGPKPHPYDMEKVEAFKVQNEHHSACIEAKVASTIGCGFETPSEQRKRKEDAEPDPMPAMPAAPPASSATMTKEELAGDMSGIASPKKPTVPDPTEVPRIVEVCDPLCEDGGFEALMHEVVESYWQVGNGYIEVVRETPGGKVDALYFVPASCVHKVLDTKSGGYHYVTRNIEGEEPDTVYAAFGDVDDLIERANNDEEEFWSEGGPGTYSEINNEISELIHFRRPSSLNRWYGYADWLSCVATMELISMSTQHQFDFFLNRGVPEFLMILSGTTISEEDFKGIEEKLKNTIGPGNAYKSLFLNIPDPGMQLSFQKLANESQVESLYVELDQVTASHVVTAHGVPPLLAGIQVPGKLGATNELPNAMAAFQKLRIGPAQRLIMSTLRETLGSDSAGLGLKPEDFVLKKITEEILDEGASDEPTPPKSQLEVMSRMRDPAAGSKRDLSQGLDQS